MKSAGARRPCRRAPALLVGTLILTLTSIPSLRAELLAYEPFTNAPGTAIIGSDGGSGFLGPWQSYNSSQGTATNTAAGLGYTDEVGRKLVTSGGAGLFQGLTTSDNSMQPIRPFNFSRGTNGTDGVTTWISFLAVRQGPETSGSNPYGRGANVPHDFSSGNQQKLAIGNSTGAPTDSVGLIPRGSASNLKSTQVPFSQTNFIVVRVDHNWDFINDDAYLFVNPPLGSEPALSEADTNSLGAFDFSFDRLRVFAGGNRSASQPYAEIILDEYRLGETYADVTPFIAPPSALVITNTRLGPDHVVLTGTGGSSGAPYHLLTNTVPTPAAGQWSVAATNTFLSDGSFIVTNPIPPGAGEQFFRVSIPVPTGPSIVSGPVSITVAQGEEARFDITADGTPPLLYQWYFNTNTVLPGETAPTLIIPSAQATNEGVYSVRVVNSFGDATSDGATLTVNSPPLITEQPNSMTVGIGSDATFSVTAAGTVPFGYQWYFNTDTLLAGETNSSLDLSNVQTNDAGAYHVVVTNSIGAASSELATLTVVTSPTPGEADGYATLNGGTTGGAGGPIVTVTDLAGLEFYIGQNTPYIVQVQGTINLGSSSVRVRDNTTIVGIGSGTLLFGNLKVADNSNVIIRNLTIANPAGVGDGDGLTLDNAQNVWVDHCTFVDCSDGSLDITHGSDWITVSWCKFHYTFNSGHNFVNLIGHSDNNAAEDTGKLHVTFHHNWWSTLCVERMPRVRFGRVHSFNNYFNSPGNNYCIRAALECEVLVENNYFQDVDQPWEYFHDAGETPGKIFASGNEFVNVTGLIPATDSLSTEPNGLNPVPYAYALDPAMDIPAAVTNNAGAGRGPFAP